MSATVAWAARSRLEKSGNADLGHQRRRRLPPRSRHALHHLRLEPFAVLQHAPVILRLLLPRSGHLPERRKQGDNYPDAGAAAETPDAPASGGSGGNLPSTLSSTFQYDAAGRQTKTDSREVTFTPEGKPRSVTVGGVTTDLRYGPGHQRVEKLAPDSRTVYIGGLYEKRITADSTQHVFFIPGDTGIVAQVTRTQIGAGDVTEEIAYLVRDHLGSASAAFDQAANVEAQVFDPWGDRIYHSGPTDMLVSDVLHGYTDQRHEDDLGWIDMNARMYDPGQRRFISPDPLVADPLFSTGRNRFAYVLNNPLRYTDPTGMGGEANHTRRLEHHCMVTMTESDIDGFEFDWLASDGDDAVGFFSTAGGGYAPPEFLRDTEAHERAIAEIRALQALSEADCDLTLPAHLETRGASWPSGSGRDSPTRTEGLSATASPKIPDPSRAASTACSWRRCGRIRFPQLSFSVLTELSEPSLKPD